MTRLPAFLSAMLLATTAVAGDGTLSLPPGLKATPLNPASLDQRRAPVDDAPVSPPATSVTPAGKGPIATAWLTMPETGQGCGESLAFDYGVSGGMRNVYCRALGVLSWEVFTSLAPTTPFLKGPHKKGALTLEADRDFGRYDPKFVRWATRALVPASTEPALRAATQKVYDRQFRMLARLYFLVEKALAADAAWVERERRRYLVSMDDKGGGWDVRELTDPYHAVLGSAEADWGGHDPNLVRGATMWWLRRQHDTTRPLWADGLQRLLATYDGAWLAQQVDVRPAPLPRTAR